MTLILKKGESISILVDDKEYYKIAINNVGKVLVYKMGTKPTPS